jgi:hypothetical protein
MGRVLQKNQIKTRYNNKSQPIAAQVFTAYSAEAKLNASKINSDKTLGKIERQKPMLE